MPNALKSVYQSISSWLQGPGGLYAGMITFGGGLLVVVLGVAQITETPEDQTIAVVEGQFFEIATGSVTGTYYPLGNAIASVISYPAGSVRCIDATRCGPPGLLGVVQAAPGSVANIKAVHEGATDSAFAQANVVNQAALAQAPFETPYDDVRAISGLYGEAIHLVVARGSDVQGLADLRGRRVSIDREGSGTFGVAQHILATEGITSRNTEFVETSADQSAELLISGELDAFFFVAGPPVRAVGALANLHLMELIPITGAAIDTLVDEEPYLTITEIAENTYLDTPAVITVGVTALWIVHRDADEELIYRITRALWNEENRDLLMEGPAQAALMRLDLADRGVPIPFHPGAERFYREAGLLRGDNEPVEDAGDDAAQVEEASE